MAKKPIGVKKKNRRKVIPNETRWNSDVIVDLMRDFDFPFVPLNPGSSFRALHDSMVNYGQDDPQMMLCPHENIAIQIAHGYAKATGEPLAAIVHNLVGLLHSCMAVYYAYIDRVPIFLMGATGPMDTGQRRPRTDWIHTANVQGNAIRDYTKWDDQPVGINSVPSSFGRAYSVMMTEPQGPVYTCYDTSLLEAEQPHAVTMPDASAERVPTQIGPDQDALAKAADMLVKAKNPVLLADWAGRMPHGYDNLVELAETVSAPVVDIGARLNFPSHNKLNMTLSPADVLKNADLILCLDARDWEKVTTTLNSVTRKVTSLVPKTAKWIDISFADLEISSWSTDYQRPLISDLRILADTAIAMPMLSKLCRKLLNKAPAKKKRNETRLKRIAKLHDASRADWEKKAKKNWNKKPMTTARLASEVWDVIKDEDWVTTSSNLNGWTQRLWDFDKPYRFPGYALGTSTQIGIALGVALAHRDKKRLVVDMQPDGDLMFDPGALWVAAKYEIPMLVVMYNNRSYYNDHEHQIRMAKKRGTPVERAYIGMDIDKPQVNFAGLARSMGWYAEGPIEDGKDVGDALRRAIKEVKAGRPALVDTVSQYR